MKPDDAIRHLETIRTLMERVALYRRALGPTALLVGLTGLAGAAVGILLRLESAPAFASLWLAVGAASFAVGLAAMRREAIRHREPFWTPAARRVAEAVAPAFVAGAAVGLPFLLGEAWATRVVWLLPAVWLILYGCGLHAAGFFMPRGIRWLGWCFVIGGAGDLLWWTCPLNQHPEPWLSHLVMGLGFGLSHLAYGAYLHLTARPQPS
ncbi:MAG: hypothetical protein ACKO3N_02850 [Verrucomicrobiota bacterium]